MESPRSHKASPDTAPHAEPWCRNLLHTFDELLGHARELERRARAGTEPPEPLVRDAYLTVCALSQVVDDFVHRGFLGLEVRLDVAGVRPQRLDKYLQVPGYVEEALRSLTRRGSIRILARALDATVAARVKMRAGFRERHLLRCAGALQRLACELALLVASDADGGARGLGDILERLVRDLGRWVFPARLRRRVLKIPSCFKDFDLHPEDCRELVRRFAMDARDRGAPVTVVGIRTSGSYLAPLCAGYLQRMGFRDVVAVTMRPKVPFFRWERRLLGQRGRRGDVLVVDDPPVSGSALGQAVRQLARSGVPAEHTVPLILAEPDSPFARQGCWLQADHARAVVLARGEWWIHRTIADGGLRARIPSVLGPRERSSGLQLLPLPPSRPTEAVADTRTYGCRQSRCHEKVRVVASADGDRGEGPCVAMAKGVGLGWFEEHVRDTARALDGFVPDRSSVADGILLARWVDGMSLADRPDACGEALIRNVARYVAARFRRLAIRSGATGDLEDRETGWHVLAQSFARSYTLLAPLAYHSLRQKLAEVSVGAPRAVVDGKMGPAEWILPARGGGPVKVDFEEHDFDRMDLGVLDPVFDLASFILENRLPPLLEELLVAEYVSHGQDRDAGRRLPVYKLMVGVSKQAELRLLLGSGGSVSLGFERQLDPKGIAVAKTDVERWLSSTANHWLAHALAADEPTPAARRMFAVDLDGVLEDSVLGFSATTPAGAAAIRMLKRHGLVPVPATGRSLREVIDRCRGFRLPAGVAEYGSVVWIEGEVVCLASREELEQLGRLREILAGMREAIVDPAYAHSVRVFRHRGGLRGAMPVEWMYDLLQTSGLDRLRVIAGEDQLDVVGSDCNKGRGILLVQQRLSARELHATGDTIEDVAMLRVADRAYAPANVRADVVAAMGRRALFIAGQRRQRGLLEIAQVAAHGWSRACQVCEPEPPAEHDATLLQVFGIRDRSRVGRLTDLVGRGALRHFLVSQ